MKLNKKGYMLVEIIVASVLAMSIAYYLLNLTYKFKNTNEDLYQSYSYMNDKILITKNIMNDLERRRIAPGILYDSTSIILFHKLGNSLVPKKLEISKVNGKTKLEYGKHENGNFDKSDLSYYEKKLDSSLIIGDLIVNEDSNSVTIKIPIKSIYNDEDYTIKLFANKQ